MSRNHFAAALLTLVAAPIHAEAQDATTFNQNAERRFARMDADHDGRVALPEFFGFRAREAAKQENPTPEPKHIERAFAGRDADKDGKLTLAELATRNIAKLAGLNAPGDDN